MSDLVDRLMAAGRDDRLADGQLYLDAAKHIAELERIIAKHIYDESHGQRIDSE